MTGTGFLATSTASLNGSPLTTTFSGGVLTVSGFAAQSGLLNLTVSNGASVSAPFSVQVGNPNAVVSAAAARRFLERAAFGPSPSDAANVQAIGPQAWLSQQFGMPQISNYNSRHRQPGRHAAAVPDQRRDESGSASPARRVRAQPDLRDFPPEAHLGYQHGHFPGHAAGRRLHQLPADYGGRDAQLRHGPVSRYGEQRQSSAGHGCRRQRKLCARAHAAVHHRHPDAESGRQRAGRRHRHARSRPIRSSR